VANITQLLHEQQLRSNQGSGQKATTCEAATPHCMCRDTCKTCVDLAPHSVNRLHSVRCLEQTASTPCDDAAGSGYTVG
jgi:hypothetical protein